MFQTNDEQSRNSTKTVILAAECLHGFVEAGRFADNFLLDNRTRVVLLNTFKRPMEAASRFRNFYLILKQNAEEDLSLVKTTLIKNYGLASEKIDKVTIEGELNSVISNNFSDFDNLTVVLGYDFNIPDRKEYYETLLSSILKSTTRPIFIISDFLTVIESSRVVVISDVDETIPPVFLKSLRNVSGKTDMHVEIVTLNNGNTVEMSNATKAHFSGNINIMNYGNKIVNVPSASS